MFTQAANSFTYPITNIVIVGAGPAGLYAAILLKDKGFNNVIVIDPRAGAYTEPGWFDVSPFNFLKKHLNITLPDKPQYHVKDVKRMFYNYACSLGITICKKRFSHFVPDKKIQVEDQDGKPEIMLADLVFDCTGTARTVIHALNAAAPSTFTIETHSQNPVPKHFLAYVSMSNVHYNQLLYPSIPTNDKHEVACIEQLRSQFGWDRWDAPYFTIHSYDNEKVCIYSEVPESLRQDQKEDWLKAMFFLLTQRNDISFSQLKSSKTYPNKPRFNFFNVQPSSVNELFFAGNAELPAVFPAGDAQINCDYRHGICVTESIKRLDELRPALSIDQGAIIKINLRNYSLDVLDHIEHLKRDFITKYAHKQWEGLEPYKQKYLAALNDAKTEAEKNHLQSRIDDMQAMINLRPKFYHFGGGCRPFDIFDIKNISLMMPNAVRSCDKASPCSHCDALVLKEEGDTFFKNNDLAAAKNKYLFALVLLGNILGKHYDERVKILCQLCEIAKLQGNITKVIETAEAAFTFLTPCMKDFEKYFGKLRFYKLNAYLTNLTDNLTAFKHLTLWSKNALIKNVPELTQLVQSDYTLEEKERETVKQKFEKIGK